MSTDGQGTLWRRNIAENFNRLSRAHERYRRQTDDRRQTAHKIATQILQVDSETLSHHAHDVTRDLTHNATFYARNTLNSILSVAAPQTPLRDSAHQTPQLNLRELLSRQGSRSRPRSRTTAIAPFTSVRP